MSSFPALKNQTCKQGKISNNLEKHGAEEVSAFDIPLETEIKRGYLNKILGAYAYQAMFNTDVNVERPNDLFDRCEPLLLKGIWVGAQVMLTLGKKELEYEECRVTKVSMEPKTGGVAVMKFTLRVHPESSEVALLLAYQNREITLDLKGAKESLKKSVKQTEMDLGDGGKDDEDGEDAPPAKTPGEHQPSLN